MKTTEIVALGVLAFAQALLAGELVVGTGGIGVVILERVNDKEPLRTQAAYPGSPAERAGITTKGFLISVDGTNAVSMTLTQAVSLVRGPVGTLVTVEIADSAMSHTNKFTVKRSRLVTSGRKLEFSDQ